jgi:ubiquinone biosynthesis protein
MLPPIGRRVRHLRRYQEIAQVLFQHGFENIIALLGLRSLLTVPMRMVGRPLAESRLSTAEHLRLAAEELGPTFVKLGQILSTRPDLLPPDFLRELAKLRDEVPAFPFEQVRQTVERELGAPLGELFASFEETPLAAASLGQVHGATLLDGTAVVVKVLRPRIREIVETDLDILFEMARLAEERTPLGQSYPLVELADEFAATLRGELDYVREGQNAERFRRNFAGRPDVVIPKIYWQYTTHDVLTMQRLAGVKIDDLEGLRAAGLDPRQVALRAIDLIMQETFTDGFFHADPHPGNFFVLEGNIIGAMDFGMVGYLDQYTKEQLMRLFVAVVSRNVDEMVDELVQMEMVGRGADHRRLARDLQRFMEKYWGVPLEQLTFKGVFEDIMPIAFRHRLTLPSNLWMLGKTLVMMEGVGRLLYPELDVFEQARPYAEAAIRQANAPAAWLSRIGRSISDWGELWQLFPQRMPRLLDQLEKGELTLAIALSQMEAILKRLDRLVNRLAVAILLAALIIGLGLIIPRVTTAPLSIWGSALIIAGFVVVLALGVWLLWSMWRAGRK